MSLKTWEDEFYPVPAYSDEALDKPITHSLRKWIGLMPENLERHGLKNYGLSIGKDGGCELPISAGTCALCALHLRVNDCIRCPLFEVSGQRCEEFGSAYQAQVLGLDPLPMIDMLTIALVEFPE